MKLAALLPIDPNNAVNLNTQFAYGNIPSLGVGVSFLVPAIISFAMIAVTFYIVISGIKFIVSEGDKASISEAKKTITHTIIGLMFLVLLFLVLKFVPEFFGLGFRILE